MRPSGGLALAANVFLILPAIAMPTKGLRYFLLGLVVTGIARSYFHFSAGGLLAQTHPNALKAAGRYWKFGLLQSLVMPLLALKFVPGFEVGAALAAILAFAVWPLAVMALTQRKPVTKAFNAWLEEDGATLMPNDRGFQGAGVLMVLFGLMGCIFNLAYLTVIIPAFSQIFQVGTVGVLVFGLLIAGGVRSAIHLRTGQLTLSADYERFASGVNRYLTWAVIWGVFFLALVFSVVGVGGLGALQYIILILAVMTMWPGHLAAIVNVVAIWDDEDEDVPRGHAVDGGLSAVGFALIALGCFNVSALLFTTAGGASLDIFSDADSVEMWLKWASAAFTLWAGIELATMSQRYKVAGLAYAAVGIAGGIYAIVVALSELSSQLWMSQAVISTLMLVSLSLALPAAVGWLVLRPLPKTEDLSSIFD